MKHQIEEEHCAAQHSTPRTTTPDILLGLSELIFLKAKAVDEVFAHLLHLVIRKHL